MGNLFERDYVTFRWSNGNNASTRKVWKWEQFLKP